MVAKPKSETEAEAMRAALATFDEDQRKKRRQAEREQFKPLATFTKSKEFTSVIEKARELAGTYAADPETNAAFRHTLTFMERLATIAETKTAADQ